ncbi:nicotinate-nucleotide--dimethylbenzimidazole phosphoribosyltransferase family protein [Ferrimonas aestuarii]|uniref:Uncharacterized protein n=1 Tax=Ferrimonas aestuarii TaxID=2569539 RepID=A0A4U1BFP8_9GAMM|nr:hypothetical protein [Ferrimonas aestuarii]TKB50070.1 hypothetical protein FCL42_20000 [Ferrimonas aestuarii]
MSVIGFTIINGIAPLAQLHRLSDAGAGANLMHLTPTRDSEVIAYGRALTELNLPTPEPGTLAFDGLLGNGGISPSVLTHGLLQLLTEQGFEVEFRSFNFGNPLPQTGQSPWKVEHFGGEGADHQRLCQQLLETLIDLSQRAEHSVLAECGVGGTTFSTLWLRGLTGKALSPAGSTKDPEKLAQKEALLTELCAEHLESEFCLERMLATQGAHDPIQQALCHLFRHWPRGKPLPFLAGGMMFLAPLLACQRIGWFDGDSTIATTRWVLEGDGSQALLSLPQRCQLLEHSTDFNQADHHCLHRYEQGQVVEGCGLGGTLVLAEQLGVSQASIVAALDGACRQHIQAHRQRVRANIE